MRIATTDQSMAKDFNHPNAKPWNVFFQYLRNQGHEIVSIWDDPEALISMNFHSNLGKIYKKIDIPKRILILWEPSVTKPSNFSKVNLHTFGKIYSPSHLWDTPSDRTSYFKWPQGEIEIMFEDQELWRKRNSSILLVQSNKYSFVKGEMYSFRRKVASQESVPIELYGDGWTRKDQIAKNICKSFVSYARNRGEVEFNFPQCMLGGFKKSKGSILNKSEKLREHKFSLIIENSIDYVSEKLFHCLAAGTIPLYIGPELSKFGIPPEVCVQFPPDLLQLKEVYNFLTLNEDKLIEIRRAGESFTCSKLFSQWQGSMVMESLARDICNYLKLKDNK